VCSSDLLLMQAGDYFIAAEAADAPRQARTEPKAGGRFPLLHIVAIAALLAALGVSLLYRQQEPADDIITEPSEPVDFLRGPLPGSVPGNEPAAEQIVDAEVVPPEVLTLEAPASAPLPPVPEAPDNVANPDNATATDYNFPAVAPVPAAPAPAAKPQSPVTAAKDPVPVAPAVTKTAPVAAPAPVAKAPVYDRSRLLHIPSGFVVQLFGSYEAANADKFRRQWRDEITGSL